MSHTRKPLSDISNSERLQIYALAHSAKQDKRTIVKTLRAQQLPIPAPRTLRKIINENHTHISPNRGGNRKQDTVTDAEKQIIWDGQRENNMATLKMLQEQAEKVTGKKRGLSTIGRVLKEADKPFTTKVSTIEVDNKNSVESKARRVEWVNAFEGKTVGLHPRARNPLPLPDETNTIYLDEAPFNQTQHRTHGRSPLGEPARKKAKVQKGVHVSLIGAISPKFGLLHYEIVRGKQKKNYDASANFTTFVKSTYAKLPLRMKQHHNYWIMDNASFHNEAQLSHFLRARVPFQTVLYLPSYTPALNPIENCWSVWKNHSKNVSLQTTKQVYEEINESAKKVTPRVTLRCFRHIQKTVFPAIRANNDM
jgi:transposase